MVSLSKVIGLMSCSVVLCLGLSSVAQAGNAPSASDVMKTDSQSDRTGYKENAHKGEVLRVEGENYVIKGANGKEVRLHVDNTTKLDGTIKVGDKIEAQVTEKDHAVSVKHVQPAK